jgi:CRP-like cAMP-binding protein
MNTALRVHPTDASGALPGQARQTSRHFLQHCRQRARVLERGAELVGEGHDAPGAVWILSGRVALRKTLDDGRGVLFDLIFPIDMIEPATADMCSSGFEMTAAETCVVALFTHEEAKRLQTDFLGLAQIVGLLQAAGRARRSERMLRIVQGRAEERVAFLILELALRLNRGAVLAGAPFGLRLSQRMVGELTGLSNVHVCRVVSRLSARGVLRVAQGRIEVRDTAALSELARISPQTLARAILV